MSSHITPLLADVERERKVLNKFRGGQVHSNKIRASLREIVERYFKEVRPLLSDNQSEGGHLESVDVQMQELLALCHKHGSVEKYKDLLRAVKSQLLSLPSHIRRCSEKFICVSR